MARDPKDPNPEGTDDWDPMDASAYAAGAQEASDRYRDRKGRPRIDLLEDPADRDELRAWAREAGMVDAAVGDIEAMDTSPERREVLFRVAAEIRREIADGSKSEPE